MPALNVAIVGATGAVGRELAAVLGSRGFPVGSLRLFASERSAGKVQETPFGAIAIEAFDEAEAGKADLCLLAVSGDFAKAHARALTARGAVVVDNSSALRLEPDVPLVVPEVNAGAVRGAKLIANPNCTTAIALMALAPLHEAFGLKKVIVSTYQAASGAGQEGMDELEAGLRAWAAGEAVTNTAFRHPLPFNVIPHIDSFQDNLYTREEMKVTWETRKIMGLPDLPVSCTCVRIPTMRAHCEAITIETERPVDLVAARAAIAAFPGTRLVDEPAAGLYPMPLTASGIFDVEVGRVRPNPVFGAHGLDFFVVGDQLLKGAALNAVQIAEVAFDLWSAKAAA
jgi:aspartate-semialdehyde dehydrogenase